jgi:hypothetical protein
MTKNGRNGAIVWILGLLTLVSILNLFNAIIQLNLYGSGTAVNFSVFSGTLGSLNIEAYFWLSTIVTILLFSVTIASIYRGLPIDPQLLQRIAKVEENLAVNSNMLENTQIGFFRRLEENEKMNDDTLRKINLNMQETTREVSDSLTKQTASLQNIEKQVGKSSESVEKQAMELSFLRRKLKNFGKVANPQKPRLRGSTKLEELQCIPPKLANKLKEIKITKAGEFLATDAATIAEKTGELSETIANLQAIAQLLMVPGIDEKRSELLVRFGVTSRRELASQDPVQLYRGLVGIAKTYVEHGRMSSNKIPTIEDVSSWIKQAHL